MHRSDFFAQRNPSTSCTPASGSRFLLRAECDTAWGTRDLYIALSSPDPAHSAARGEERRECRRECTVQEVLATLGCYVSRMFCEYLVVDCVRVRVLKTKKREIVVLGKRGNDTQMSASSL